MDYNKNFLEDNKQKKLWRVIASVNVVILLVLVSYSLILSRKESSDNQEEYRSSHSLGLINPKLSKFDLATTSDKLQADLTRQFELKKSAGELLTYGFFFRDLGSGHGFGINEHETFIPASLLKLPTAMAYYKKAELNPEILSKQLSYRGPSILTNSQHIPPREVIEVGKSYAVNDLIERSLKYSDNLANTVLVENIDQPSYNSVFKELDLTLPKTPDDEVMTVKAYASVFRNLYNSNYLSLEYSQKLLDILVHADYSDGLKSGIPDFIKIAHKFGERQISDGSSYLHDCGIIYSDHPYIICVMTHGKDIETLTKIIGETSEMVYGTMGE